MPRFAEGNGSALLEEFHDAREVVGELAAEYAACESADYVGRGGDRAGGVGGNEKSRGCAEGGRN